MAKESDKPPIEKLKTGAFQRAMSLTMVGIGAGARLAGTWAQKTLADSEKRKDLNLKFLIKQAQVLATELGQLKGSVMKVGQMLSMYGEHFLPPEANQFLKSLQSESTAVSWAQMHKVLLEDLGAEKLSELAIVTTAFASASMGQVHVAVEKSTGRKLALKVQYPGVDRAIDSDLKTLRRLLSVSNLIPADYSLDEVFDEVQMILNQEVDYRKEFEWTEAFYQRFKGDSRYIIPQPISYFSSRRVLTTVFEEGLAFDHPQVLDLSQERRNRLGFHFLEVYFREIFEWGEVQTDPHFGNYKVRIAPDGQDQLILLDFGAVRRFEESFLRHYYDMVTGAQKKDADLLEKGVRGIGFLKPEDTAEQRKLFYEICVAICEPFQTEHFVEGVYDWGNSELPRRLLARTGEVLRTFKLRPPPREIIFLDRKLGGVFIALSRLGAKINGKEMLEKYLALGRARLARGSQSDS